MIIAGGGTGGHLFPAVALGEELVRERPDTEVLYVGTRYGFEAKWLPKTNYRYELYDVHGLLGGRGAMARMKSIRGTREGDRPRARDAESIRRGAGRDRGRLCVGADGPGRDSLAHAARPDGAKYYTGFFQPDAVAIRRQDLYRFRRDRARTSVASKVVVTGIPVRYQPRADRKPISDSPLQILVLGASTGAHRLNLGVLNAFKIWRNSVIKFAVTHQTGEADEELVRAEYQNLPLQADVIAFIDDVPGALSRSDLVVARSGGGTVTDVALAARPAIFVPYPFHRDRQQFHNARVIEGAGGAIIVNDDDNLGANLAREIERLASNPESAARDGRQGARRGTIRCGAENCAGLFRCR